ncbi:O-antigen biosynthesis glycosyltransferase WbnK [bioreactor metagenome]|uniref:O-antigen biosynthesis glycosyltransferase WbnK n=1 Tax=bioreactor metagenome TaxID=1076179 RepID=A0A644T6A4_9ZZZZ|nr:alpha-1,2-fucosyltransferase [Candidatus Elulimicrobiales bacterium]
MIKVKIQAGLGNQMFQYALARYLQEKTRQEIILDLSYYSLGGVKRGDTPRGYELDKFNINESFKKDFSPTPFKATFFGKILRRFKNESAFVFYKKFLNPKDGNYLIGFWQSEKYFKDIEYIIRKEFTLKNRIEIREDSDLAKQFLNQILFSKNSISVNVRRGDYANNPKIRNHHGLLSIEYFIEAVKYVVKEKKLLKEGVKIFIFSDDVEWCRENLDSLKDFGELVFVSKDIIATDSLYLISKCKYNVIANSSFSWWAAWLNNNPSKIVIAPKKWMRTKVDTKDVCPHDWIRLENRFY